MYILKNAIVSITRNKGRNILIGIIVMVIACFSTITLAIKNTSSSLIDSYKETYKVEATIGFNRENMKNQFDFTNKDGMDDMKESFDNMASITIDDTEFTIVGIFEEKDESNFSMFSNSANTIITNTTVIEEPANVNPTFILTFYDDAKKFEEELYNKGLDEFYTISTNEEEVLNATNSVSNVSTFALTFLILTLIIGAIVLFVINQINIRERKYEIGVLRTIGMKKSLLTLQFVIELSIVAFISLLIGCGIGTILSKPVGNSLLQNEIENSQNNMNEINNNVGGGPNRPEINGVVKVEAFDSINAVVDYKVVLELLLIGISLTLVSSISSMISIQKFSPLQILKERS